MLSQRSIEARHQALLEAAVAAARGAALLIRESALDIGRLDIREKRPADFVSEVDEGAESRIRDRLLDAVPGATVVGEELSPGAAIDGETVFVVDPLDGTTNFLHGFEAYSVSIGALVEGRLAVAVVLDVPHDDLYTATAGGGAWLNGRPMRVSSIGVPGRALIGTGFPFKNLDVLGDYLRQFERITRAQAGLRRAGSAALDLAWLAAGRFDGFWELRLAPWDIAAGLLLIREAGGRVTDLAGLDVMPAHTPVVASNGLLHEWLLECLGGGPREVGSGQGEAS
jgi:myo-inositol-1(or 4)-monophosphatase